MVESSDKLPYLSKEEVEGHTVRLYRESTERTYSIIHLCLRSEVDLCGSKDYSKYNGDI